MLSTKHVPDCAGGKPTPDSSSLGLKKASNAGSFIFSWPKQHGESRGANGNREGAGAAWCHHSPWVPCSGGRGTRRCGWGPWRWAGRGARPLLCLCHRGLSAITTCPVAAGKRPEVQGMGGFSGYSGCWVCGLQRPGHPLAARHPRGDALCAPTRPHGQLLGQNPQKSVLQPRA